LPSPVLSVAPRYDRSDGGELEASCSAVGGRNADLRPIANVRVQRLVDHRHDLNHELLTRIESDHLRPDRDGGVNLAAVLADEGRDADGNRQLLDRRVLHEEDAQPGLTQLGLDEDRPRQARLARGLGSRRADLGAQLGERRGAFQGEPAESSPVTQSGVDRVAPGVGQVGLRRPLARVAHPR
jgi:hypothetical protein